MEWEALIVCGKARLRARFEGGSSSGFGEAPAIYRTANPAAQHIIEQSDYFKDKRIRLLRVNRYADDPADDDIAGKTEADASPSGGRPVADRQQSASRRLVLEEKHFNDPQLARRFLHDTFGVPMAKITTYAAIREAGELYGYKISWDK